MDEARNSMVPSRQPPHWAYSYIDLNARGRSRVASRSLSQACIRLNQHPQMTRATAGIRRKAATVTQLTTTVARNTSEPFAAAGRADFNSPYCSQLTKA